MKFEDLAVGVEVDHRSDNKPNIEDADSIALTCLRTDYYPDLIDYAYVRKGAIVYEFQWTTEFSWMCMTKYVSEFWKDTR